MLKSCRVLEFSGEVRVKVRVIMFRHSQATTEINDKRSFKLTIPEIGEDS
jgi:hypothetical protein